jgi:protoheme IX farnesyltransferase
METAYNYGVLVKPKVLLAMLALYITSYLTSLIYMKVELGPNVFVLGFLAVAFAVSGANVLNCYIDRDVDAVMARTRGRPLVPGTITPQEALGFSGVLMGAAALFAIYLGVVPVLLLVEGAVSYLVIYTLLLKKRTSINVLATAPSVAAPAWFGWYMGGAPFYPLGFLMGLLVAIWGPLHLWSIAFAFAKDYKRAGIPMYPSVVPRETAIRGILIALIVMLGSSYLLTPFTHSQIYAIGATLINLPLAYFGAKLGIEKSEKAGWWLFKLTAPYILLIFTMFLASQMV